MKCDRLQRLERVAQAALSQSSGSLGQSSQLVLNCNGLSGCLCLLYNLNKQPGSLHPVVSDDAIRSRRPRSCHPMQVASRFPQMPTTAAGASDGKLRQGRSRDWSMTLDSLLGGREKKDCRRCQDLREIAPGIVCKQESPTAECKTLDNNPEVEQ